MFSNKTNSSLWPCLHLVHVISLSPWNIECIVYGLGGIIFLFLSIICLIFNIRYCLWYRQARIRNTLVLSLFLASLLVLCITMPGVILQLFTCHRHCNGIYCRIEGFTSYFSGCLCMLIYTALSIDRYLLLCRFQYPLFNRYSTIICWIISLIYTFPPVFDYWISYVPEGLGFHCSINWNDHSKTSLSYILSAFLGMYFIPLIILLIVNVRVKQIIEKIYSFQSSYYSNQEVSDQNLSSSLNQRRFVHYQYLNNRSSITYCYIQKAANRKRFRIQHRIAQATIFLVGVYIFAWTPYSLIALLQMFHIDFIFRHTCFITLAAFIAKLSVISAPLVYLSVMNNRIFKKIFFQE